MTAVAMQKRVGFFPAAALATTRARPLSLVPRCGDCGLYRTCSSPKMPVAGRGAKKILVVGEAPGKNEDEQGRPFVGPSGDLLERSLGQLGVHLRQDCWVTNAVRCRPVHNATPTARQVGDCRPYLVRALEELRPEVVLLLGKSAVDAAMGWLWREEVGPFRRWVGWAVPSQRLDAWVVPTYHPAYLLRSQKCGRAARGDLDRRTAGVVELLWRRHLGAAVGLAGSRPWPGGPPDYGLMVRRLRDTTEAVAALEGYAAGGRSGRPVAFDFEHTPLKPDGPHARLITLAVSDGLTAAAVPWGPRVEAAARHLLVGSGVRKVAHNMKHEDRWCRRVLGVGVPERDWLFDSMLAAHVLDNRRGVCSLKFQAFVRLGLPPYDTGVAPYLKPADGSGGGNSPNRVDEIDLDRLLLYNGLDALLTWELAMMQMDELRIPSR